MHKHKLRLRGPGQHCQRQVHGVSAIRPTRHNHRPVAEDLPRLVRTVGGHGHNNGVNYPESSRPSTARSMRVCPSSW